MSESSLNGQPCVACGTPIQVKIRDWSAKCPNCGTWRSNLEPEIESASLHRATIDPGARAVGLRAVRDRNNQRILDEIGKLRPLDHAKLLDIGSAHGWFLDVAAGRGIEAEGIEPERAMVEHARAEGLTIREGYFPNELADGEQADIISFNDVLEHIPDVDATLEACAKTLRPGGVLSVNIPASTGLGYRIVSVLARLGISGPYQRFWQFGLPSPHTFYFPPAALEKIIERHGLTVKRTIPLSSVQRKGLWARLHYLTKPSPKSVVTFGILWLLAPILDRPKNSDIVLILAQRAGE